MREAKALRGVAAIMEGTDTARWAQWLTEALPLDRPPLQISYLESPPDDSVPRHEGGVPSVCTFFAEGTGRPFYAALSAHEECEIGAYVLGIPPEGALGDRLRTTLGEMEAEGYLSAEEAARVPHNAQAPRFVAYGPLGQLTMPPTVVLLFARPKAAMLVLEAAGSTAPMLGRPMCSIVPTLLGGVPVAVSAGCVGSRLYAGLGDDLLIVGLRGDVLPRLVDPFRRILAANRRLSDEDGRRQAAARHPYRPGAAPAPRSGVPGGPAG